MNTRKDFIDSSYYQHTVKSSFTCIGRGLHSGKKSVLQVLPGEENKGIVFVRKDINESRAEIQASWQNVSKHRLSVSISNALDVHVDSIEHIMAALYACDIDNAKIVVDGPEIPIMDGSTDTFVSLINQVGRQKQSAQRHAIIIKQPVSISNGEKFVAFLPSPVSWIEVKSQSNINSVGGGKYDAPITARIFEDELAAARVFVFAEQIDALHKWGLLQGRTMHNSVLIDNGEVINKEGLRFDDEYIRHECVRSLGDIALIGARLVGQFTGLNNDHKINHALIKKLINDKEAWDYSTVEKSQNYWENVITNQNKDNPLVQDFISKLNFCTP